jgi:beta-fructofuranosidase
MQRPAVPRLGSDYTRVYCPAPDVFPGPDSARLRAGETYTDWVPNDHTLIPGPDGHWHMLGITHPSVPLPDIHEGEWLAFHARSDSAHLSECTAPDSWLDLPKVLPPAVRHGERCELYAPFVIEHGGLYWMYYGPAEMRLATSTDLYRWTPCGPVFEHGMDARDPCVIRDGDGFVMVYVAGNTVFARESRDLRGWTEPTAVFTPGRAGAPESPFLVRREEGWYLFWCIYDGTNGCYDNRTFVQYAPDWRHFASEDPVAQLQAHAPEIVRDENGNWLISSAEWPCRGVSLALLDWRG